MNHQFCLNDERHDMAQQDNAVTDDSVFHPSRVVCPPNDRTAALVASQESTYPVFMEPTHPSARLCPPRSSRSNSSDRPTTS